MIKNKVNLEIEAGERIYQLECYPDSPLGELYDVLCKMKGYVIDRMVEEAKKSEKKDDSSSEE